MNINCSETVILNIYDCDKIQDTDSSSRCVCLQCEKSFEDASKLKKHTRRSHAEKIHMCPECGKRFALLHKLKIHSLCHTQFTEFLCALCGKGFKRRDKLRCHIERVHSAEKETKAHCAKLKPPRTKRYRFPKQTSEEIAKFPYKCTICVIGFRRRGILVNHMSRLHPEVSLESLPQLARPVIQHQRSYKCHYCDRVYMSNGKRKSHMLSYHPGANLAYSNRLLYTCCPAVHTPRVQVYRNHLLVCWCVSDVRVRCLVQKDCQDLGSVTIEPRICSLCPRQFLTNAKLLQHQRKLHPISEGRNFDGDSSKQN